MNEKTHFKHKGILEWIVPYLVVLILPIFICSAFFIYNFMMVWEETRELNVSALQLISDDLDEMFETAYELESSISQNYMINNVRFLDKNMPVSDNYKLMLASNALDQYSMWDNSIQDCTVFFPKLELWMNQGYRTITKHYDEYAKEYGMDGETFRQMLFSKHAERQFFENKSNGNIGYVISYPYSGKQLGMNILIELDMDYIQNKFAAMDSLENSGIMFVDEDGRILAERNMEAMDVSSIELPGQSVVEYHSVILDGKKVLISCVQSKMIDLTYVAVVPYADFWHRAISNLMLYSLVLIVCMVLGLVISWFFARMRQKSYGQLKYFIKEQFGLSEKRKVINQKEIAQAVENLIEDYKSMRSRMVSETKAKREMIISSIMEGKIRSEDIEYILQSNSVEAKFGNYILIAFSCNRYESIFEKTETSRYGTQIEKMAEVAALTAEGLLQKEINCDVFHVAGKIIFICDFGSRTEENCKLEVQSLINDTRSHFKDEKGEITIAISELHSKVFSLNSAYIETMRIMEYQMIEKDTSNWIMEYSDLAHYGQIQYLLSIEEETELIALIKCGKAKEAKKKVQVLYERSVLSAKSNRDVMQCLNSNFINCVLQAEVFLKNKDGLRDAQLWIGDVCNADSMMKRIALVCDRIDAVCDLITNQRDNKEEELARKIQLYIQEHYMDAMLDNSLLAELFGVSQGYLMTTFKKITGETLLNYIQQLRIEKAKELLVISELSVEEIANAIGCSGLTLRRLFKKNVGVSPTQFRESKNRKEL